jgi:hypothetical protein
MRSVIAGLIWERMAFIMVKYERPTMEMVELDQADVILTSGTFGETGDDSVASVCKDGVSATGHVGRVAYRFGKFDDGCSWTCSDHWASIANGTCKPGM